MDSDSDSNHEKLYSNQTIDRYLMFYSQSTAKGHIKVKQNVFVPQEKHSDSLLNTHSIVEDWRNFGEMKLNELGRQKLGR